MIFSSLQSDVDKGNLTSPRYQSAKSSVKTKLIANGSEDDKVPLPSTYIALPSKSPSHKASKNRTAFLREKLDFYDKMNSSHIATNIVDRIFEDTTSRIKNGTEEMKMENHGAGRRLDGRRSFAEMRHRRTEAPRQFENSRPLLSQSWHFEDKSSSSKQFRIPLNLDDGNRNNSKNSMRPKSQSSVLGRRNSTKKSNLTPDPSYYGPASSCADNRAMNLPQTSTSDSLYPTNKPMIHILDHFGGKLPLRSIPSPGKIDLSGISRYSNSRGEKSEGRSEDFSSRSEKSEVKSEDSSRRSHSDLSFSSFSSFADSNTSLKTPYQTERNNFGAIDDFDMACFKSENGGPTQRQDSLLSLKETPNGDVYESRLEKSGKNRKLMNGFGENSARGIYLERTQKLVSEANDIVNAVLSRDSSSSLVTSRDTRHDDSCSSPQNRAANSSFSLTGVSDATMSPLSLSFVKKSIAHEDDIGPKLLKPGQQADWFESTPKSRYSPVGQHNYRSPINGFRTPLQAKMVSVLNPTKMEMFAKQFHERKLVQRFFKGWLLVRRVRNEGLESLEAKRECKRKAKAWVKVSLSFTYG